MGGGEKGHRKRGFEVCIRPAASMADDPVLPHDRGHLLWTKEDGASRILLSSINRWVEAMVGDDGIDMPLSAEGESVTATVFARESGLVVGCSAVDYMLQIWAPSVRITWFAGDGKRVSKDDEIASLTGDSASLLAIERPLLNLLGQLSGIATATKSWSAIAPRQIACTRKTVWGMLDKWAVHMGGGLTHRLSKHDAIMIKENDLATLHPELDDNAARIATWLQTVNPDDAGAFLEVEVRTEKEALMAAMVWSNRMADAGVGRLVVMLDNFTPDRCRSVSEQLKEQEVRHAVVLEASGGIVFDELENWRECGLDVLSTSAINRGVKPLDVSMLFEQR